MGLDRGKNKQSSKVFWYIDTYCA